jgi:hypothetical protein
VRQDPDQRISTQFKIKQLLKCLISLFGIGVTRQTIYNILKRNNMTNKIAQIDKYPHPKKNRKYDTDRLKKELSRRKNRIISIDETGINLNNARKYAWSEKGKRCFINKPNKKNNLRFSLLFGISKNKIIGYKLKKGAINGNDFSSFINCINKPNGKYYYLMDNARIHHSKVINDRIKRKIIYNIPYSPQYNPIKYVNNCIKQQIKKVDMNSEDELKIFIEKYIKEQNKKRFDKYFEKSYNLLGI